MRGFAYYKGHRGKHELLKVECTGTVLSGNATATTFGNTLRVLSYLNFIAYKTGVSISPFVAGDDLLIILERQDADKFKAGMSLVYCNEATKGVYGLGLVMKELN